MEANVYAVTFIQKREYKSSLNWSPKIIRYGFGD